MSSAGERALLFHPAPARYEGNEQHVWDQGQSLEGRKGLTYGTSSGGVADGVTSEGVVTTSSSTSSLLSTCRVVGRRWQTIVAAVALVALVLTVARSETTTAERVRDARTPKAGPSEQDISSSLSRVKEWRAEKNTASAGSDSQRQQQQQQQQQEEEEGEEGERGDYAAVAAAAAAAYEVTAGIGQSTSPWSSSSCPAPITDFRNTACARLAARYARGIEGDAYTRDDVYVVCALPHVEAVEGRYPKHPEDENDGDGVVFCSEGSSADCVSNVDWHATRLPYQMSGSPRAPKWPDVMKNSTPFVYVFVHVVKTGGTSFEHHLIEFSEATGSGGTVQCHEAGSDVGEVLYQYSCLMDSATASVVDLFGRMQTRTDDVDSHFSDEYMRSAYADGRRFVVKGEYGMGLCDVTTAPCAYLTILREPLERAISFYKYICLQGSENFADWAEGWHREDPAGCPLDLVDFFDLSKHNGTNPGYTVNRHVHALAPGGDPLDPCTVEAAKMNLASPCTRYLLTEKMEDGLTRLPSAAPDFERVRTEEQYLNGGVPLSDVKQARLDGYVKDETMMGRLREMVAADIELYKFAVENYEAQWDESLEAC